MTRHPEQCERSTSGKLPVSGPPPQVVVMSAPGRQTVWWVMTVALVVIATALVMRRDAGWLTRSALGQSEESEGIGGGVRAGARGIYAFSGQLTSKTYGLFMVDVDTGTIWCYELSRGSNNELQMRLVAARSWIFDRYLEEFNVGEPIPAAVEAMVQRQRSHREDAGAGLQNGTEAKVPARPSGDGGK